MTISPISGVAYVDGELLLKQMNEDLHAWNQYAQQVRISATHRFAGDWEAQCDYTIREFNETNSQFVTTHQTERLRLFYCAPNPSEPGNSQGVWVLWHGTENHRFNHMQTLICADTDLMHLYESMHALASGRDPDDGYYLKHPPLTVGWGMVEEMLRTFIVTFYNPSIPVEAAEQTVTALGGRPTMLPKTLKDAPSPVRDPMKVAWAMETEFRKFVDDLPPSAAGWHYPNPTTPEGLPEGWVVRWHAHFPATVSGSLTDALDVVLVERLTGGWGVFTHTLDEQKAPRTALWDRCAATVRDLYTAMVERDLQHPLAFGPATVIRNYVLSHYDLTDPYEAGEKTLIGLGAPLTVFPRALP